MKLKFIVASIFNVIIFEVLKLKILKGYNL